MVFFCRDTGWDIKVPVQGGRCFLMFLSDCLFANNLLVWKYVNILVLFIHVTVETV